MSSFPGDLVTTAEQMNQVDPGEAFAYVTGRAPLVFQCVGYTEDGQRLWASPGTTGYLLSADVLMFFMLGGDDEPILHQILKSDRF